MQRLQAFKFELVPTGEQQRQMHRFAGSCRFVYNKALALQKERHEQGDKKLGYAGLCKLLTVWRNSIENFRAPDAIDSDLRSFPRRLRSLTDPLRSFPPSQATSGVAF